MGVPNGAGSEPSLVKGVVPTLNVEPCQFLQRLGTEVRHDLVLGELAIALSRARRDTVRCRLPLVNAGAHEAGDRGLARFDVGSAAGRSDQFREFDLCLALGALE